MPRELYPEEEDELKALSERVGQVDGLVSELLRSLKGDSFYGELGFIAMMIQFKKDMEVRMVSLEAKNKRNTVLMIGIGIGIGVASVIFGVMTIQQLKSLLH